jgi:hypothetical protein
VERLIPGTGTSDLDDSIEAGRAAATAAMVDVLGEPVLVMVYASVKYDLAELLAGVRSVTGVTPLAGFTTSGHFAHDVVAGPAEGVAVLVLSGGDYRFGVASATGLGADPIELGTVVARSAKAAARKEAAERGDGDGERPYSAFVLLTDGLGGDQQSVLTGVHRVAGAAVPVVGGAAGDDRRMQRTYVFHDDEALTDSAVGIWISSRRPLAVKSAHGWHPLSDPLLINRSEGALIHEIGGRPAAEVFDQFTNSLEPTSSEASRTWRTAYALGLIEPNGSHLIRGVFGTPDGPLSSFTHLPAYAAVQVMTADPGTLLAVIDPVVEAALVYGDETVLLAFDCIARMEILGDDYPEEIARIAKAARGARCFGAYTYTEFARAKGVGGVHNSTLTALAL